MLLGHVSSSGAMGGGEGVLSRHQLRSVESGPSYSMEPEMSSLCKVGARTQTTGQPPPPSQGILLGGGGGEGWTQLAKHQSRHRLIWAHLQAWAISAWNDRSLRGCLTSVSPVTIVLKAGSNPHAGKDRPPSSSMASHVHCMCWAG
jgi:hypothetical protein